MNGTLTRISISTRIAVLGLLPMLALLGMGSVEIVREWRQAVVARHVSDIGFNAQSASPWGAAR